MPGVRRAATPAAAPAERSWRRVSSLVIVGSRPCSVAPVASGRSWGVACGAWRRLFQRLFRGLSLAAGTIHTDTTQLCWNNSIRTALNRKLSQCVCVEGAGLIPGPTIVLRGQVALSAVPHFVPPPGQEPARVEAMVKAVNRSY